MKLKFALVSANENTNYWRCYPIVKFAWERIIGVTPVFAFTGKRVPRDIIRIESNIVHIDVPESKSTFYSQNCRLILPAYLNTDEPLIISDIDMAPLSKRYFLKPIFSEVQPEFHTYRDVLINDENQVAICYNAARRNSWQYLFRTHLKRNPEETLAYLYDLCQGHDGVRGGNGWFFDQKLLFHCLANKGDLHWNIMEDIEMKFNRLDRLYGDKRLEDALKRNRCMNNSYTDFHMLMPYPEYSTLNDAIIHSFAFK